MEISPSKPTLGLIGGMSWQSSAAYYRLINEFVQRELGGSTTPESVMLTVDFSSIEALQHHGNWAALSREMQEAALRLERAGAGCIALCTNTMHKVADSIQEIARMPLLHIVDATADDLRASKIKRAALLGTRFTMEDGFYQSRMWDRHGIAITVPSPEQREEVHHIIYAELCRGLFQSDSRDVLYGIAEKMAEDGNDAVILGCTELGLLLEEQTVPFHILDSTRIHAEAIARFWLK